MNNLDTITKFSQQKDPSLVPSVLAIIIFTRKYFQANKDLESFTVNVLKMNYKPYLFKSRTSLFARVIKDKYIASDADINLLIKQLVQFLDSANLMQEKILNDQSEKTMIKKKKQTNVIDQWRKVINPDAN